jgi:hypothetical protein
MPPLSISIANEMANDQQARFGDYAYVGKGLVSGGSTLLRPCDSGYVARCAVEDAVLHRHAPFMITPLGGAVSAASPKLFAGMGPK